ncbi:EKC/KEOPS complex subunit TP53RK [Ostrinia nubilalis]|uniref:EKC/KEOPS complex subunit TP53RK n=1 Tax=Ostrinia furnacalis TaxID=93504 RepID=UPI00103BE658|nr:EKC/KEOPS complex subunit TP53RK [Ostrinia furnacalis]XP_028174572.1 EKC/KEOPS complex subunit TP53RK [Ostrinia furnacalis]
MEEDLQLLKQGAEAKVYKCTYLGLPCIVKERFQKNYRHPDLDACITKERIRNEARAIARCKSVGVKTPCLYLVDFDRRRIYMEHFTHSISVKDVLISLKSELKDEIDVPAVSKNVAVMIGAAVRRLHDSNMIHGDLTTSNMLLVPRYLKDKKEFRWHDYSELELSLIDFGLSYVESKAEDKGVDLYVLERALISTHNDYPDIFNEIMLGYTRKGEAEVAETLAKFKEVQARGRKRTMVG